MSHLQFKELLKLPLNYFTISAVISTLAYLFKIQDVSKLTIYGDLSIALVLLIIVNTMPEAVAK